MRVLVSAFALTMVLAGCATAPGTQVQAASSDAGDVVCTREYPIGTNIPVTKCRTRAQAEAEKASAIEGLKRVQTGGPSVTKGGV
jgi:hypothetical protein